MEIVDTETLANKDWSGLMLPAPYSEVLGEPSPNMSVLVWGPKGSGKSTWAMGLSAALLPYVKARSGTVLYVSAEEGAGRTTAERAERLGAADEAFLVSDFRSFGALFDAVEQHNARVVVLDSASVVASGQSKAAAHLMETLRKVGVATIVVSHALKGAHGYKGNSAIGHACYAEIRCFPESDEDTGEVRHLATAEKNRYAGTVGDVAKVPMTEEEILPLKQQAIQHSIRENFGGDARQNPKEIDCTAPQSAQCRAIFASLSENGQAVEASSSGPSGKQSESEEKASEESSSGSGRGGQSGSSLERLENLLGKAID